MKTNIVSTSNSNPLRIQKGHLYNGASALMVDIIGTVGYRVQKDSQSKSGYIFSIGLEVLKGEKVQDAVCTTFNSYCNTDWTPDEILPLKIRTKQNGAAVSTSKTFYLTTPNQPELEDMLGNSLESIMLIPLGAKVKVTMLMHCYRKSGSGEWTPWKELVSVKICEMPTKRRAFIPCDPEEENQGVTDDLETID